MKSTLVSSTKTKPNKPLRIGLVVPHIFMQDAVIPDVIFSPGQLALSLAAGLQQAGAEVTLFTPGAVTTPVKNITADLSYFARELAGRGDTYVQLLKKHPLTFISLARQVQAELIAAAYAAANRGELDIVHIYTNEEELALPFASFCRKPVVFTHHDPFNFLVRYKNFFPKYRHLPWLAISDAQRRTMPADTQWVATIHHGLEAGRFVPATQPKGGYVLYLGRIIESKGVHIAIAAARLAGKKLVIAGKHYSGAKDTYWREKILPFIDNMHVQYVGYVAADAQKQELLANADALLIPSTFEEPFGMVMIESLACGTPVIGLDNGAISEVVKHGTTGFVVKQPDPHAFAAAITQAPMLNRKACRADFEARFTLERMVHAHLNAYKSLIK